MTACLCRASPSFLSIQSTLTKTSCLSRHSTYASSPSPNLPSILTSLTSSPDESANTRLLGCIKVAIIGVAIAIISKLLLAVHNSARLTSKFTASSVMTQTTPVAKVQQAMTYAEAGVSIDAGNELVRRIKAAIATTKRPGADTEIGGFGGVIDLQAAGYEKAPSLIQATDGVGTKLKIAFAMNKHDTVGIDLVAMNVNDLVVQGAEPLSFLDYFACGKLEVDTAVSFVEGVAKGCREAGCALVGGETAEMPSMYQAGEYDAAGTATGAVEHGRKLLPEREAMREGDVLLALASSGVHSNGFSLVRKILENKGLTLHDRAPWDTSTSVGEALLIPTRIYVKPCLELSRKGLVMGMAHVTGGGLIENVPRALPNSLAAEIDVGTWQLPPVFRWLKEAGNVDPLELARVFNTGIGMVLVVPAAKTDEAASMLRAAGENVTQIGRLVKRTQGNCILKNLQAWD